MDRASSFLYRFEIDRVIQNMIRDEIVDWIDDQREAGLSETTINNREVLTRGFYQWLTSTDGHKSRDNVPWDRRTITGRSHSNLPRFVTLEQVIRLLNATHNESQRVAFHFMYDTGVRVSELVRMTNDLLPKEKDWPEDVNYYPLLVPGSKPYDNRPYKYRYTIISRPMLARMNRYHATTPYLFAKDFSLYDPNRPSFLNVHGRPLSKDSVQKAIDDAWLRQGGNASEMSSHRLRHGLALSILRSELGKDLHDNFLILKNMLGHARISSTEIYAAIPIAALRSLMGKQQVRLKYDEAEQILAATYLPLNQHKERRGHHSR
jgi:integrase/recombinase XerC